MMDKCLVEMIVPVYNKESSIRKCLESILCQTYTNFRVIIIDDGSTDASVNICKEYTDDRIVLIEQENKGVGGARNAGLDCLIGEKVAFVDADDFISPSYLSDMLEQRDFDLVIQGYCEWTEDGIKQDEKYPRDLSLKRDDSRDILFNISFFRYLTMPWNKLFSTKIIQENNIRFRNINLGEDLCFVFDYIEHAEMLCFTQKSSYNYVLSNGSLTRSEISDVWERQKDLNNYCRKKFYPKYGKIWTDMYVRAAKRTLGEASNNSEKFINQIKKIRFDEEFSEVKIYCISGVINKIIFVMLKLNLRKLLWVIFRYK